MDENKNLMHDFAGKSPKPSRTKFFTQGVIIFLVVAAFAGMGTGFLVSAAKKTTSPVATQSSPTSSSAVKVGQTYGVNDTKTFPDTAEGTMKAGGIDGEGAYHLERPGGDSQNVYLTSSVVDLSLFVGHKVKVWGQTNAAQHAGWLMDVGKVEVEN